MVDSSQTPTLTTGQEIDQLRNIIEKDMGQLTEITRTLKYVEEGTPVYSILVDANGDDIIVDWDEIRLRRAIDQFEKNPKILLYLGPSIFI